MFPFAFLLAQDTITLAHAGGEGSVSHAQRRDKKRRKRAKSKISKIDLSTWHLLHVALYPCLDQHRQPLRSWQKRMLFSPHRVMRLLERCKNPCLVICQPPPSWCSAAMSNPGFKALVPYVLAAFIAPYSSTAFFTSFAFEINDFKYFIFLVQNIHHKKNPQKKTNSSIYIFTFWPDTSSLAK